jgi:hypothetical protein
MIIYTRRGFDRWVYKEKLDASYGNTRPTGSRKK